MNDKVEIVRAVLNLLAIVFILATIARMSVYHDVITVGWFCQMLSAACLAGANMLGGARLWP